MVRVAAAAALLLVLGASAAAAHGRSDDAAATIARAVKTEELALQELRFRHVDKADELLNESRVLLAGVAAHVSGDAEADLRAAERFDEVAIEWSKKKNGLQHALAMVETALSEKKLALTRLPKATGAGGLGCTGLLGESQKSPGESEVAIRGCTQAVSAIELEFPRPLKSISASAVVSKAIPGGFASSKCVQPKPTEVACGGYPTFDPAGGVFLLDVLPHASKGDRVTATIHGKTLTATLTLTQR